MRRLSFELHEAGMSDHPERLTSRDRNGKPAPLGGNALGAPSRESDSASHSEGGCGLPTTWIGAGNRCARDHWAHVGPASGGATCRRPRRGPNHGHHGARELAVAQEPRGITGSQGVDVRPGRASHRDRTPGAARRGRTPTCAVAAEAIAYAGALRPYRIEKLPMPGSVPSSTSPISCSGVVPLQLHDIPVTGISQR